jgi:hypothetical protein
MLAPVEAKVDDTKIFGKWHCTRFQSSETINYTFKSNMTWTDGDEIGTYTHTTTDDTIYVFSPKGKVIAKIAGVSGGLAGTKAGDFYVANTAHNSTCCTRATTRPSSRRLAIRTSFPSP